MPEKLLRETLEAQAERIVQLERQLEARTTALEAAAQELSRLKAATPADPPRHVPPPRLTRKQRLTSMIILAGGRVLPSFAKRFIKRFWDPWKQTKRVRRTSTVSPRPLATSATYDILCFAIIDWSFRWQRPQQLVSQFARAGHRVFVFNTSQFLPPRRRP
jgi:hypothetical protein